MVRRCQKCAGRASTAPPQSSPRSSLPAIFKRALRAVLQAKRPVQLLISQLEARARREVPDAVGLPRRLGVGHRIAAAIGRQRHSCTSPGSAVRAACHPPPPPRAEISTAPRVCPSMRKLIAFGRFEPRWASPPCASSGLRRNASPVMSGDGLAACAAGVGGVAVAGSIRTAFFTWSSACADIGASSKLPRQRPTSARSP